MRSVQQMEADLQVAHAAGDTKLAKVIAERLTAARDTVKDTPNLEVRLPWMDKGIEIPGTGGDVANTFAGAGQAVASAGRGIRQFAAERGIGNLDAANKAVQEAKGLDSALMDTKAGIGGNIAANLAVGLMPVPGAQAGLVGAMGTKLASKVPQISNAVTRAIAVPARGAATGAAYGLAEEVDRDAGETRTGKILSSALGGAAGETGAAALGRIITPMRKYDPDMIAKVMRLEDEGIPVTAAQATGNRFLEGLEGAMASNPILAHIMKAGSPGQKESVSRAVARRFDVDGPLSNTNFLQAVDNVSDKFKALDRVAPEPRMPSYLNDVADITIDARNKARIQGRPNDIPGGDTLEAAFHRGFQPEVTGAGYNEIRSVLTNEAHRLRVSGNKEAANVVARLRDLEDNQARVLWSGQGGSGPAADIGNAHRQWGQLKDLEKPGVIDAAGGVDPIRLSRVVANRNPQKFLSGGGNEYDRLAQALAILKPIGQGSTTSRNFLVNSVLYGGAGAGALGALTSTPELATGSAAAMMPWLLTQTRLGRKTLTNKLLASPEGQRLLAKAMHGAAVAGSDVGAKDNWSFE